MIIHTKSSMIVFDIEMEVWIFEQCILVIDYLVSIGIFFGDLYGTEVLQPIHFYVAFNINEEFDAPKTFLSDVLSEKC